MLDLHAVMHEPKFPSAMSQGMHDMHFASNLLWSSHLPSLETPGGDEPADEDIASRVPSSNAIDEDAEIYQRSVSPNASCIACRAN